MPGDKWIVDDHRQKRSVLELCIGDTVTHDLIDYLVVAKVTYNADSGCAWTDYYLEGDGETWLVYEKDIRLAAIYEPADLALTGEPPQQIKYCGKEYCVDEESQARVMVAEGQTTYREGQCIRYRQYQNETGEYALFVEDRGGCFEVSCGYCIRPDELRVIRKLRTIY